MAIDTTNEKLSLMDDMPWDAALPINPGTFDQDELQHMLWEYAGILWAAPTIAFVLDLNTRIWLYLGDFYSDPDGDLTTMIARYLDEEETGDYNNRMLALIESATP